MKVFFGLFALLAVFAAAYPFLFDTDKTTQSVQGLPWQIQKDADGNTQVFSLQPGHSRLSDAIRVLGDDLQLAVIAAKGETGTLEMYYGHYRAGLLSGRIILQAENTVEQIEYWKATAIRVEVMPSGQARRYQLDPASLPDILHSIIIAITFIPAVNLDEATILSRFGKADEVIKVNEDVSHYLYADRGLDIALSQRQKEVLQYVQPERFEQLRQPLLQAVDASK